MADRKVGSGKKVSTLGVKDPAVRRRIAALEIAAAANGG